MTNTYSRRTTLRMATTAAIAGIVGASVPGATAQEGPAEQWRLEIDGEAHGGPTVVNGDVHVTIDDAGQSLYSFDGETGDENWSISGPGTPDLFHHPHVVDGVVYAASSDGMVKAFDQDTQEEQWTFTPDGDFFAVSPILADGTVYVVGSETQESPVLFAVDADDGEKLWSHEGSGGNEDPPIVVGETVYYSTGQMVFAVDANDGEERWTRELGEGMPRGVTVAGGELYTVYTERTDGGGDRATVTALDADTGEDVWTFETEESRTATPTVYNGKVLVYAGENLVALDIDSGEELWRYGVATRPDSNAPPTVADGVVYFGSFELDPFKGILHAVDVDSGDGLWEEEIGEFRIQQPPIVSEGTLYAWAERDPDGLSDLSDLVALDTDGNGSSEDSRVSQALYNHHDGWTGEASVATDDASGTGDEPTDSEGTSDDESPSDDGTPGFGIATAAAAIGGAGYVLRRQFDDSQTATESE